jgi:hypothetical protein
MKFKVGSLVEIIDGYCPFPGYEWVRPGLVGEIVAYVGPLFLHYIYWEVKFPQGIVTSAQEVLRLIPADPEGRQVVEWNWRELVASERVGA